MRKKIGLMIAGFAVTSTFAFAGLTLHSDNPNYTSQTVKVKCTDKSGTVLIDRNALVGQNVPWALVKVGFLKGGTFGHCEFTYTKTGAIMGQGDVSVDGISKGKVNNVKSGVGFTISVSPDQNNYYGNVTISVK